MAKISNFVYLVKEVAFVSTRNINTLVRIVPMEREEMFTSGIGKVAPLQDPALSYVTIKSQL